METSLVIYRHSLVLRYDNYNSGNRGCSPALRSMLLMCWPVNKAYLTAMIERHWPGAQGIISNKNLLTTSTPRFLATAITVLTVPKSQPTTDMLITPCDKAGGEFWSCELVFGCCLNRALRRYGYRVLLTALEVVVGVLLRPDVILSAQNFFGLREAARTSLSNTFQQASPRLALLPIVSMPESQCPLALLALTPCVR